MSKERKGSKKAGSSANRQGPVLAFANTNNVYVPSFSEAPFESMHILRDTLFVSAGVDVCTIDEKYLAGVLQHGAVVNSSLYTILGKCKTSASFYSTLQQSRFVKYYDSIVNNRLAKFVNYLSFLVPDFDYLATFMFTPCALKLNMDSWSFDEHIGALPAFCPGCNAGKVGHYGYLLQVLRAMDEHIFFGTDIADVVYEVPPSFEEAIPKEFVEQLPVVENKTAAEVFEMRRHVECTGEPFCVPYARSTARSRDLEKVPLGLSRGRLRIISLMVEEYDDFIAQGFEELPPATKTPPVVSDMVQVSEGQLSRLPTVEQATVLLERTLDIVHSSLELSGAVRALVDSAIRDYDYQRHIDKGVVVTDPATATQTEEDDIPDLVDDEELCRPDTPPGREFVDDALTTRPEDVAGAFFREPQVRVPEGGRLGGDGVIEATSVVDGAVVTGVSSLHNGERSGDGGHDDSVPVGTMEVIDDRTADDNRRVVSLDQACLPQERDVSPDHQSYASIEPDVPFLDETEDEADDGVYITVSRKSRRGSRWVLPSGVGVPEIIDTDDPDHYRAPDDNSGETPQEQWKVATTYRTRNVPRAPVLTIKAYRSLPFLSNLYEREIVFNTVYGPGPVATAVDPDVMLAHPRDPSRFRVNFDDREALMKLLRFVRVFDPPPDVSNYDSAVRRGCIPSVEKFARLSSGCEHYAYLVQWQHRCLFQHTHMHSCSFGDMRFSVCCTEHGYSHGWEWIDFTIQSILTYRDIDPKVGRKWLEQLLSTPIMVALLRDPPKQMHARVNWIKRVMGVPPPDGYRAQGSMDSVSSFLSKLKELPLKSYEAVKVVLSKVTDFLVSIFTSMVSLPGRIPDLTKDLVKSIVEGYLKKIFEPLAPVARWTAKHTGVILASIEALVVAILLHFDYITLESAKMIVGCSTISALWAKVFTAQSESPLTTVMMLLTGVFYMLRPTHIQVIRDRLSQLSLVMATAGMLSSTASFIFMLLPEAIRMSLKYTFGGSRAVMSEQVSEWRAKVATANRLSTCTEVLVSSDYGLLVKDIMKSGMELLRAATGAERQSVMTMLPSMMRLDNMLYRYQLDSKDRSIPFVLHLAGPPGVGKTLLVRLILNRLGYSKTDLYFRPIHSDFWDGYAHQKVIVYDEFLIGEEGAEMMAKEFLMLASSAHFMIPAASLDDPVVGIKGQYARPEMIITISNSTYPAHPSIDRDALDRRRSEVVRFEFSDRAFKRTDNTVDLSAYTAEQIEGAEWVDCYMWPPQPTTKRVRSPPVDFNTYMEHLELATKQHREVVEKLNASHVTLDTGETPAQKINKAMAEINGIPSGPVNLFSFFMRGPGFTAQGFNDDLAAMKDPPSFLQDWKDEEEPDYNEMTAAEVQEGGTSWWTYAFGAVSVSVGMFLLVKLVKSFFSNEDATVEFFPQASGEPRSRKKHKRKQRANWGGDESASEAAPVKVELVFGDRRMTALPLKERYVLTYAHGIREVVRDGPTTPVIVIVNGVSYPATVVWSTVRIDNDNDLAIIDLESNKLPQFANNISKMLNEADLGLISDLPVVLTVMRAGQPVSIFTMAKYVTNRSYTAGQTSVTLDAAFTYQADTQNGDCGGFLMVRSGPMIGKIIGMHVAGRADSIGLNYGLAVALTKDLINVAFENNPSAVDPGEEFFESQNDIDIQNLDPEQVVFLPNRSRLKPSCVASSLNFTTRIPSLLDPNDPRNVSGLNPVDVFIERLHPILPEVDMDIVAAVEDAMLANYDSNVHTFERWRQLTFEEAIRGIPGKMTSINLDSSVGLPLVHLTRKKKRDFVVLTEDEMLVDDELRGMVDTFMDQFSRAPQESHWIGYLKDELVSPTKVDEARTRVVYCGDLVATIAFRRLFGTVLLNLQQSRENLPHAIGYNPYSYDMNEIHQYLSTVGNRFIAGDYKSFDNNQHPVFRRLAYNVLRHFMRKIDGVTEKMIDHFVRHQTQGYVQIADRLFYQTQGHFSGCMFTTLVNCLVNEAYIRYCFMRHCPGKFFDASVRVKTLGDDHIICVANDVDFGFSAIQTRMRELGQVYTSDTKESECPDYRPFGELTFLGAQPIKFRGQWVGKLLKRIIQQTLMWTRDNDQSYEQIATSMMEYASMHGVEYYEWLRVRVYRAYAFCGLKLPDMPPVSEIQQVVANRTASSGTSFAVQAGFCAQGDTNDEDSGTLVGDDVVVGAASGVEAASAVLENVGITGMRRVAFSDVNGRVPRDRLIPQTLTMEEALESRIMRTSFAWSTDQPVGHVLYSVTLPQGILGQGPSDSIQNMPFKNYMYWRGRVEVALQINGNPFQQGLLCAFFYPLSSRGSELNILNWTQCQYIMLRPGNSSVVTMEIPFRYPRSYIQLSGSTLPGEDLGTFVVGVFSPLLTTAQDSVTVSVYSAFKGNEFRMPRPMSWAKSGRAIIGGEEWQAQGNNMSTVNNTYDISNVAGSVGAQSDGHIGTVQASMPMDDPPLSGGSVPVHQTFSSMSKTVGLEPTVPLQLHPVAADRHHREFFDPEEQTISWIMDRPFVFKRFHWKYSDATGSKMLDVHFDSFMGHEHSISADVPASLAILNAFTYWHADIHFTVVAVKTPYQSGRLRFVMAYGADHEYIPALSYDNATCYFNETLDFSDNDTVEFDVPYVAATEFLRTRDGVESAVPPLNFYYSCGRLACYVVNPLKLVSSTVAQTIEVIMFAKLRNVQVAVPRNIPLAAPLTNLIQVTGIEKEAVFAAQGLVAPEDELTTPPCRLLVGEKFEYRVRNVLEVARRMVPIDHPKFNWADDNTVIATSSDYLPVKIRTIKVAPACMWNAFYAGWAGTLRYRIFVPKSAVFSPVTYIPVPLWYKGHRHFPTDCTGGSSLSTDVTLTPGSGHYKQIHVRGVSATLEGPQEVLMPVSGDKEWIDVTVPFCSNFLFQINPSISAELRHKMHSTCMLVLP
uniref:Genome polyprotein n=1 Tax=Posavirus strain 9043 TaxID=1828548 RepID=A0A166HR72_9VIRU|nr:polyprotein [Posavirus strain 9043]